MTIEEIKNLIIKLDVKIDACHDKASYKGLFLLVDFTDEVRKQQILEALDTLSEIEEKLKNQKR